MDKNAQVDQKKSRIAIVFAAAMAAFQAIQGTKPRMKGIHEDGNIRFRRGTHRGFGMFGRVKDIGGTPAYNAANQKGR